MSPPAPLSYRERPLHLEVLTGIATSVGLFGVRGEYNLGDAFALGAGIGTNGIGPEWEAHARWRILRNVHRNTLYSALTLEGAFARGKYAGSFDLDLGIAECDQLDPNGGCYKPPISPQTVNWGQVELGWEAMFRSHVTLRLAAGLAHQIGTYHWRCNALGDSVSCGTRALPSEELFVFSFALGYAF